MGRLTKQVRVPREGKETLALHYTNTECRPAGVAASAQKYISSKTLRRYCLPACSSPGSDTAAWCEMRYTLKRQHTALLARKVL